MSKNYKGDFETMLGIANVQYHLGKESAITIEGMVQMSKIEDLNSEEPELKSNNGALIALPEY